MSKPERRKCAEMWAIFGIIVAVITLSIIELPSLWQQKKKKEQWIFSSLMLVALVLSIAQAIRVKLPNPYDWIAVVYQPMSNSIFGWLKGEG
jgi:hypothetical protein